jgi:hypothetical protein
MPASSFDAYFTWDGGPSGDGIAVISCNYSLSQSIDDKGRVSSKVYGGTIFIQVDSSSASDSQGLWEWMVDPDGKNRRPKSHSRMWMKSKHRRNWNSPMYTACSTAKVSSKQGPCR